MHPINQTMDLMWKIIIISGAINFVGFIISATYIIFFTPTKSKYLKHFEKHSGIIATIIEHLSPKDLPNEMLITLAASDHYSVRFGLLNMKDANTLPQHILRILSHDHDPNIEVKAIKLRSENNISPCFYPWGDIS